MSWFEIIIVAILAGLFGLWFNSTRVREIAVGHARYQCRMEGVQFLDDTVSFSNVKPARDEYGRLTLQRTYTFEFSDTGNDRQSGSIVMRGRQAQQLSINPQIVNPRIYLH